MKNPDLIPYEHFVQREQADELAEALEKAGIFALVESSAPLVFDPTFANNAPEYMVCIDADDFERADSLQQAWSEENFARLPKTYPLFGCDNQQLMQILREEDKWSKFDAWLAQKLLRERGEEVDKAKIQAWRSERLADLRKKEPRPTGLLILGYVLAILGGLLALFVGWHLQNNSRQLPNGERVFAYSEEVRQQGKIIFYIALFVMALFALWNLSQIQ